MLAGLNEAAQSYDALVTAFATLGDVIQARAPDEARNLFADYALPKLIDLIQKHPTKRHGTLRIMYAFCAPDAQVHIQVIKGLQDRLGDMPVFLHCLAILVFLETEFNADLVDLYSYYAMIGLSLASPGLRGACLGMLSLLATCALPQVLPVLPQVEGMRTEMWWEIQSQLLVFSAALLGQLHASDPEHVQPIEAVQRIVEAIFTPEATLRVRKVGFCNQKERQAGRAALKQHRLVVAQESWVAVRLPQQCRLQSFPVACDVLHEGSLSV